MRRMAASAELHPAGRALVLPSFKLRSTLSTEYAMSPTLPTNLLAVGARIK